MTGAFDESETSKASVFSHGRALIIGVAAYPKIRPLPAAVLNDARDLSAVLTSSAHCGYEPRNVLSLLDQGATLTAIREGLNDLARCAKPDDTALIFFSGHGARLGDQNSPESALLPFDCDPANVADSVLSEDEFSRALSRIQAGRLVVFLDACHSGDAGTLKADSAFPEPGFAEKSLARLSQGKGRVLIASSRGPETSLILPGANNSLFTEHLLGALRGNAVTQSDGLIRIFEVFNYVAENVRRAVPGRQHPIFKASDLEDNFPVALALGGSKAGRASPTSRANMKDPWNQLEDILSDLYPLGPQDQEIWIRAGGDVSRIRLNGTGRANWVAALRILRQGGGGFKIDPSSLLKTALEDFPHHLQLVALLGAI